MHLLARNRSNQCVKPVLAEDLGAAIRDTLSVLTDLDRAYDRRRALIKKTAGSILQKKHRSHELDHLYRKDREPLILRLADLHYRMMRASLFKTMH